jgi:hypothetical protein
MRSAGSGAASIHLNVSADECFFARSVRCGLTFAVSIARGLEMPAALVARAGEMIE